MPPSECGLLRPDLGRSSAGSELTVSEYESGVSFPLIAYTGTENRVSSAISCFMHSGS